MSTTHSADLMCCCAISMGELENAIGALPEDWRDEAWEVINDRSILPGSIDDQPDHIYLGHLLATAAIEHRDNGEVIDAINGAQLSEDLLHSVSYWKNDTAGEIARDARTKTHGNEPEFQAFVDWTMKQLADARNWGYRIIPYWG